MKDNTASNQSAPGGKTPEIRIQQTKLTNPTGKEIVKQIVGSAREMVEGMPRPRLERMAGGLLAEILMAQIMDVSEIPVKRLNKLLALVGVIVKVSGQKGGKQA